MNLIAIVRTDAVHNHHVVTILNEAICGVDFVGGQLLQHGECEITKRADVQMRSRSP